MKLHHTKTKKKEFYSYIIEFLKKNEQMPIDKAMAILSIQTGSSKYALESIFKDLEKVGMITLIGNEVTFIEDMRVELFWLFVNVLNVKKLLKIDLGIQD